MGIVSGILMVLFIIVAILLILIVLIQNDQGESLGGIFAGGSNSTFGSQSSSVLTHATQILGGSFLVIALVLALLNRSPAGSGVQKAAQQATTQSSSSWWQGNASTTPAPSASTSTTPAPAAPATTSSDTTPAPSGTTPAPLVGD
jgi:preprotein translocase subunit SecG